MCVLSLVQILHPTPWTEAHQAPVHGIFQANIPFPSPKFMQCFFVNCISVKLKEKNIPIFPNNWRVYSMCWPLQNPILPKMTQRGQVRALILKYKDFVSDITDTFTAGFYAHKVHYDELSLTKISKFVINTLDKSLTNLSTLYLPTQFKTMRWCASP